MGAVGWKSDGPIAIGLGRTGGIARLLPPAWRVAVIGALCALLAATPSIAQRTGALVVAYSSPTLKRIDETGVVRLGHRANSPPFAFLDAKKKPIGYSLDLCEIVVDEIAREVGKELAVEYRAVTPENRFELVRSGEIDLECGSSTNTAERRKVVAFSPTIFVTGTKLLVRRGSGIRSLRDLDGQDHRAHARHGARDRGPQARRAAEALDQVRLRRRSQRVVPDPRRGQGRRVRQRRRAALRHAGANPVGAAISASSAIS